LRDALGMDALHRGHTIADAAHARRKFSGSDRAVERICHRPASAEGHRHPHDRGGG
jgi:hypothetical protein